jgi:hypothetical protein
MREHHTARDWRHVTAEAGQLFNGAGELDGSPDACRARAVVLPSVPFHHRLKGGGDLDLERFTRELVRSWNAGRTRLGYAAAVHHDTDQPHVHLVERPRCGGDLVSRDYLGNGMRYRAMELATDALGYRSDLDILQSLARDVHAERFTPLDRRLQGMAERHPEGIVDLRVTPADPRAALQRRLYLGRLAYLTDNGLARVIIQCVWKLEADAIDRLRGLTRHREIQRHVERHLESANARSVEVIEGPVRIAGDVASWPRCGERTHRHCLPRRCRYYGQTYYATLSDFSGATPHSLREAAT